MKQREYLIDGLIASGSINIIAGPSGAGKTTWVFQAVEQWLAGEPILGHHTIEDPVRRQFFYISADRDEDDVEELIERLAVKVDIPHIALLDNNSSTAWYNYTPKGTSLLFIDGVSMLIEGGKISDNNVVGNFLRKARLWAKANHCALWFSCHSPKKWKSDDLVNLRENILGSIAWGGFADTVFVLQEDDPKDPDSSARSLWALPRHGKKEHFKFKFDDNAGRLVEVPSEMDHAKSVVFLTRLTTGQLYARKELVAIGSAAGMSSATTDRLLKKMVDGGQFIKGTDGEYVMPRQALAARW